MLQSAMSRAVIAVVVAGTWSVVALGETHVITDPADFWSVCSMGLNDGDVILIDADEIATFPDGTIDLPNLIDGGVTTYPRINLPNGIDACAITKDITIMVDPPGQKVVITSGTGDGTGTTGTVFEITDDDDGAGHTTIQDIYFALYSTNRPIVIHTGSLEFDRCWFWSCTDGAIVVTNHTTSVDPLRLTSCVFEDCQVNNDGGAAVTVFSDTITAELRGGLEVINTTFTDCIAFNSEGAALFAESVLANSNVTIVGSTFNGCRTEFGSGAGGVLRCREVGSGTNFLIDNSLFLNNSARAGGGAISFGSSSSNGGSVGDDLTITITGSGDNPTQTGTYASGTHFIGNDGGNGHGGAIDVGNAGTDITIELKTSVVSGAADIVFEGNSAGRHGGAIAVRGGTLDHLTANAIDENSVIRFSSNTAALGAGGAIYLPDIQGPAALDFELLTVDAADPSPRIIFEDNLAVSGNFEEGHGGAIRIGDCLGQGSGGPNDKLFIHLDGVEFFRQSGG